MHMSEVHPARYNVCMRAVAAAGIIALGLSPALAAQTMPSRIPPRVAEEAAVLQQNAPRILTQEDLEQRSIMPPQRFRPRAGSAAEQATGPRFRIREVVSEFSFGTLRNSASHCARSPWASSRATIASANACWKSSPVTAWSISPPTTR
jgi:hypothetical protein